MHCHFSYEDFAVKIQNIAPNLETAKSIAIALSGGVDSITLLHLLNLWATQYKVELIAITINHNLRPESSDEANQIGEYCNLLGIKNHTIKWEHNNIKSNIQEKARIARYSLISSFCNDNNIEYVCTAHHLGDQIEQIMISLSEGAGIYSFLIPEITRFNKIKFIRPLLDFSKENLIEYAKKNNLKWWNDDSNNNTQYLRNIIRPIASEFLKISNNKKILTAISNIKRSAKALTTITNEYIKNNVVFHELGYAKFDLKNFLSLNEETRFSIIRILIQKIRPEPCDIRLNSVKIIDRAISLEQKHSLGGCSFLFYNKLCIVTRDFGRKQPEITKLNNYVIWDNRFKILLNSNVEIKKITAQELNQIIKTTPKILDFDSDLTKSIKKTIILSLPAFFELEKLVAIPHIYYYDISQIGHTKIQLLK